MSTIVASAPRVRSVTARFYVRMALAFVAIAFLGFSPSYSAPIAAGNLEAPPIIHIHGALLFAWTLFSLAQTLRVGAGRTPSHHSWGMAGIALFTLMIGPFALAIANVHRPELHKRLMGSLVAGLMIPALARVFLALPPTIVALLLIVVAMIHDWRAERRRQPVYVYAGLAMVLSNFFAVLVSGMEGWLATVRALERLAG